MNFANNLLSDVGRGVIVAKEMALFEDAVMAVDIVLTFTHSSQSHFRISPPLILAQTKTL